MKEDRIWLNLLQENFTDIHQLAKYLQWPKYFLKKIYDGQDFPLNLPKRLAKKIQKKTLNDPLLKQFVPLLDEKSCRFSDTDPLQEEKFQQGRYIQKYEKRALLLCSQSCAMHCRFCFRKKRFSLKKFSLEKELRLIENDLSLQEIILSGRDPLALSTEDFADLLSKLSSCDHIRRIRIHTRFPIAFPERIHDKFLEVLHTSSKQLVFVLHANHPREFDEEILLKIKQLQKQNILILNQSVLLKGVNDSSLILQQLSERLMDHGILFYYLHLLDPVAGSSHFYVSKRKAKKILRELQTKVSGWGLPKLVEEIPQKQSKTLITF